MNATPLSLAEYASRLRSREQTAVGLVECCTQNYARTESRLNAYKTWDGARARGVAGAVDTLLDQGIDLGPLMGIPVSVKDMYGVPGLPVFAGSAEALPEARDRQGEHREEAQLAPHAEVFELFAGAFEEFLGRHLMFINSL